MRCDRLQRREALVALAQPLIAGREAEHTILFSSMRLGAPGSAEPDLMLAVMLDETPKLVAIQRNPFSLVLSEGDPAAIPLLVGEIANAGLRLPGVYGPSLLAERFALAWSERTGVATARRFSMTLLKLAEPIPPPAAPSRAAPGGLRLAAAPDRALVADWSEAFAIAVGLGQAEIDGARGEAERGLAEKALYLWEVEGRPVCLAGYTVSDPARRAGRINRVYTPPEERGRGYATACVSQLSRNLLLAGLDHCLIFADDANATTNALYRRIGYQPIGQFSDYLFTA